MDLKIESMEETEEGTQICGLIRKPMQDDVPPLGTINHTTNEAVRAAKLKRWTEEAEEVNKKYTKELCAYRRVHLGLATIRQEDLKEIVVYKKAVSEVDRVYVTQLIKEVSGCWSNIDEAGTFDTAKADKFAEKFCNYVIGMARTKKNEEGEEKKCL
jgi:hypothetical protein